LTYNFIETRLKKNEAVVSNFALLALNFYKKGQQSLNLPNLREPEEYAQTIKTNEVYLGYIAWALNYCRGDSTA